MRDLDRLKRSKYTRYEQFKEFYTELTRILRQYYENRYLVDALELTSSELMLKLESIQEYDEHIAATRQILDKSDLIKFAKGKSNELESGEALNIAFSIIYRTKIKNDQIDES